MKPGRRQSSERRWIGAIAVAIPLVVLFAFHAILLARRVADLSILRPGVLARWIVAALLLAGIVMLRRLPAIYRGRQRVSVIFWLLVVLLHVSMPVSEGTAELAIATIPTALVFLAFLGTAWSGTLLLLSRSAVPSTAMVPAQPLVLHSGRAPPAR